MDEKNGDSEWHSNSPNFTNLSVGMISDGNAIENCKGDAANFTNSSSFSSMVDSIGPAFWDFPANSQPLGLNAMNVHSSVNTFSKLGLSNLSGVTHDLSPFPVDSAFIDRAARFSSLSMGNMMDMVSPFAMMPQDRSEVFGEHQRNDADLPSTSNDVEKRSPNKFEKKIGEFYDDAKRIGSEEDSMAKNGAEHSSAKRPGSKKRRRGVQDAEPERSRQQSAEEDEDNVKRNSKAPASNKSNGKNGKQSSESPDPPKEDYIHIRARRGQATNSHSLAERVRREKISERMKFLQDIVPGCNKVTGKAVMLDEIINYVQSLQRQVEFLSMKLATVDPRMDCNIESLLAKDQLFLSRLGAPSLGHSPDMPMVYPPLRPSQPPFILPGLPVVGSSSDALRNTNPPMTSIAERFKELNPQMHNLWGDELHNVIQMGFNPNPSPDSQETNSSSHMKVEP